MLFFVNCSMKRLLTLSLFVGFACAGIAQCDSVYLNIRQVRASDTDPNIPWELARHFVYLNQSCAAQNKLMIYMVGTWGEPYMNQLFPALAANHGYHVISIKYPNDTFASSICANDPDLECYEDFHHEILYGVDSSAGVTVDADNSIMNRALKLVEYLDLNYPLEGWAQFFNGNGFIWPNIVVAGHSQGSGHTAFMGHQFPLHRALMFAGPNEFSTYHNAPAAWFSQPKMTPDSCFYGFENRYDEVASFSNQLLGLNTMGVGAFGDTVWVEQHSCPYENSRMLYTTDTSSTGVSANHGSVVADDHTPLDGNGTPVFADVWRYMLGVCNNAPNAIKETNELLLVDVFPNPASQLVTVTSTEANAIVSLYELTGKLCLQEKMLGQQLQWDTSHLPAGMYLLQVQGSSTHTTRLVIE